jgi:endonuclease YncB( thermonuclease family)
MRSVLPFLLVLVSLFHATHTAANEAVSPVVNSTIRPSRIIDGHRWVESGRTYELYGVGGCGRGTQLTADNGRIADCGVLTTARLAAFFSTAGVTCRAVDGEVDVVPVVCVLEMGADKIDLGMALIAGGYGFAALGKDGRPVVKNYLVAELSAKLDRQGLWARQGLDQQKLRQNNGKIDNAEK